MKLNTDCLRKVMLEIEKLQQMIVNDQGVIEKKPISVNALYDELPKQKKEDIFYCLFNLEQAGYVDMSTQWLNGCVYNCRVNHMTYKGHEFLDKIRDSKRWSLVKKGMSAAKDYSLAAISAIAEGITSAALDKYINSNIQS